MSRTSGNSDGPRSCLQPRTHASEPASRTVSSCPDTARDHQQRSPTQARERQSTRYLEKREGEERGGSWTDRHSPTGRAKRSRRARRTKPRAVVVKPRHAAIAHDAVLRARRPRQLAGAAHAGLVQLRARCHRATNPTEKNTENTSGSSASSRTFCVRASGAWEWRE